MRDKNEGYVPGPKSVAYVCDHKDHEMKWPPREFCTPEDPVPPCPTHKGRKMVRQR